MMSELDRRLTRCSGCGKPRPAYYFLVRGDICQLCRNRATREERRQLVAERTAAVAAVLGQAPRGPEPRGPVVLLYRCWAEDGALLYVGIAQRGMHRVRQHAEKGWFEREVAAMTFERVPAAHAGEVERAVIRAERPRYNIHHRR
jgi:hypothetical protein